MKKPGHARAAGPDEGTHVNPVIPAMQTSLAARTPPEILSLVFHLASDAPLDMFSRTDRTTLWTFSSVCQAWRNTLLLDSSFWCRLHIDINHTNYPKFPYKAAREVLKTVLLRSSSRPLELVVTMGQYRAHMFKAIFPHASRIKFLKLRLLPASDNNEALRILHNAQLDLPILETLFLDYPEPMKWGALGFYNVPKLTKIWVNSFLIKNIDVNWENIVEFSGGRMYHPAVWRALEHMKQLRHLYLWMGHTFQFPANIRLPLLESLHLEENGRILPKLETPRLQELSLIQRDQDSAHFKPFIHAFLEQHRSLTRLELQIGFLRHSELLSFFAHTPLLEHLELLISGYKFENAMFAQLRVSKDAVMPLLPCLQVLHLGYRVTLSDDLAEMLESRFSGRETLTGLRKVLISISMTDPDNSGRERFDKLREDGLDIKIVEFPSFLLHHEAHTWQKFRAFSMFFGRRYQEFWELS